ncbi:MAG: PAS domain S-box protein, partial [Nevskia sp.]|nr:PAS domain S-box protein [Nevskia sp.]
MGFSYDFNLVPLSVIVAVMASYIALDLAGRVTLTEGRAARYWLLGGAVAMGAGIWSMHFIGMLAVRMPIPLGYDPALTAASLLIAVMTSGFALALVSRKTLGAAPLAIGALIMGAGICGMHYTGMAAMQMAPAVRYDAPLFATSVLIAVAASLAALWLAFTLRTAATPRLSLLKVLSAVIMGIAISGMHYTGMEAARFAPGSVCTAAFRLPADSSYLGYGIGAMILVMLSLTLLASLFDARLESRTAVLLSQLRESAERYRTLLNTSTDAVLLVDQDGVIRYANTTVEKVFGHRPREVIGQPLLMLQPGRLRQKYLQGFRRYLETHRREFDWRIIELPGLRRDGREIPLEMSFSEIELEGQHLFAAFIRDISERKERDHRIARLNRVQAVLSGIDGLIVRAKGQQELFDGSCQVAVGQGDFLLAWIGMVDGDRVRPVAQCGRNDGYLENNVNISLSGRDPRGRGPT